MARTFWNIIYYVFAKHLPKSNVPVLGSFALRLRNRCAHGMFAECNGFVNLEQGAYVGNGSNIHVLSSCCIGKDFRCHARPIFFHGGVLMGENVLIQGGGACIRRRRRANWQWT